MASPRVNEIDLLRFLAAFAVVFFHYSFRGYAADAMSVMPYPLLASVSKYGYLGVELFFIISGFVILMTAANGSLQSFVISRIVRLYPAFWVCCTLTFLVTITLGKPRFHATIVNYLVNMTMLSGFVGVPSLDGAYWSLFVEIRFYLLVACALAIGRVHQAQTMILFWLVASVGLELWPIGILRSVLITDYAAYFIAGAACFLIWSKGASSLRVAIVVIAWLLATVQSITALKRFEDHYQTSMNPSIVAGIVTAFFIAMMLVSLKCTGPLRLGSWRLAGGITYPLYLLHERIGFIVFNKAYPAVNSHLLFWSTLCSVLGLALAVHVFVERRVSSPFKAALNKLGREQSGRGSVLAGGPGGASE